MYKKTKVMQNYIMILFLHKFSRKSIKSFLFEDVKKNAIDLLEYALMYKRKKYIIGRGVNENRKCKKIYI